MKSIKVEKSLFLFGDVGMRNKERERIKMEREKARQEEIERMKNNPDTQIESDTEEYKNKFIIAGAVGEYDPFYITINNIVEYDEDGFIKNIIEGSKYLVVPDNGFFSVELDIFPVTLDFMFVQNLADFTKDPYEVEPIVPDIECITNMCSLEYVEDKDNILYGLSENVKI